MNNTICGDKKKSGIYQIRNTKNNKVYIGQSKRITYRKSQHRRELKDGKHYNIYLQRSFDKYGEDAFVFEVLEYCHEDCLNERERYWIEKKESEYADKGYNAAYAVTQFEHYDKHRRVNKNKRKCVRRVYTEAMKEKQRESLADYWKSDENHINHSLAKSEIDLETIIDIKMLLAKDLDIELKEVAEHFKVSINSVTHIRNLASHKYILKEHNFIIKNRHAISEKRKDKITMRMYREGYSYQEIGVTINAHHRNVIRRINKLKNIHDDRCRLNAINRAMMKKLSLARTLSNMGYNDVRISKLLKMSRNYVMDARKGKQPRLYTDVNQIRGKVKPCEYKKNRASGL